MAKSYKVAVVGATGLVGQEMLKVLEERGFPVGELVPMASPRSAGERIEWGGQSHVVRVTEEAAFKGVDIALMSAGGEPSKTIAPMAAKAGAVVIDNSSAWRMDPEVPLVVPEVNAAATAQFKNKRIIANPNCSTIQMVVALAPLHRAFRLKRVVVSTYQAVSGAGKKGMDELGDQVRDLFGGREPKIEKFPKRIAFNLLPHIDVFLDDGFTKEEHKMIHETRKILGAPEVLVCPTCVRVPVFNSHSESVVAEFHEEVTVEAAKAIWREAPGVVLTELLSGANGGANKANYPTPLDADGTDATYIGRVRKDPSAPNSLAFWCVADNLRKGAASNAVQIAEVLARDYL